MDCHGWYRPMDVGLVKEWHFGHRFVSKVLPDTDRWPDLGPRTERFVVVLLVDRSATEPCG